MHGDISRDLSTSLRLARDKGGVDLQASASLIPTEVEGSLLDLKDLELQEIYRLYFEKN